MKKINKAKRSGGELLALNELFDRSPTKVNDYGIWLRYRSRTNIHNMYKEYRDVTINGAVSQMYAEMAGRHRADPGTIQIINTATLKLSECKRDHVTEMHQSMKDLKFPIITKLPFTVKKLRTTFKANRPTTFVR
jgi:large subunit ribosomal protein L18Ae